MLLYNMKHKGKRHEHIKFITIYNLFQFLVRLVLSLTTAISSNQNVMTVR